jgi:hypothetical protein
MRCNLSLILFLTASGVCAAEPSKKPILIVKPEAFETLFHPNCSHCLVEANRRKQELRADDRVLCWIQVLTDSYINDGAIPIRFFLNTYRVLSDSWGGVRVRPRCRVRARICSGRRTFPLSWLA